MDEQSELRPDWFFVYLPPAPEALLMKRGKDTLSHNKAPGNYCYFEVAPSIERDQVKTAK